MAPKDVAREQKMEGSGGNGPENAPIGICKNRQSSIKFSVDCSDPSPIIFSPMGQFSVLHGVGWIVSSCERQSTA